MKEAILSVHDGDASSARKVKVKLTKDHLILHEIQDPSHFSPLSSTAIDSPTTVSPSVTFSRQTTASLSSTNSSSRGSQGAAAPNKYSSESTMPADDISSGERNVTIKRQPGGGLGISVKGGAEHGIPVLISRVFPGQAADQTHLLHPGDAIMAVNDKKVDKMSHDDVVAELRSCGPQVSLTVRTFDGATQILRPSTTSTSNSSETNEQTLSQTNRTITSAMTSQSPAPIEPAPSSGARTSNSDDVPSLNVSTKLDSSVIQAMREDVVIPLLYARVERYQPGADIERERSFEVLGEKGGLASGLIQYPDAEERDVWLEAVCEAIHHVSMRQAKALDDDVTHAGWVYERSTSQTWKPSFVALSGGRIHAFDSPPGTREDWSSCQRSFELYECLCRPHPGPRLLDGRNHCFSIQHGADPPLYCNVPTGGDATRWDDRLQKSTHEAIFALKRKSYPCSHNNRACVFSVHFNDGFQLVDDTTQETIWSYKFSQLKGSSDDGDTVITFTFHNRITGQIDRQSFTCASAYPLLFCVHAFLAAKLSLVDPTFLDKVNAQSASPRHLGDVTAVNGDVVAESM